MALKLKGSTSGFVAIDAPSVAGNNTLILPENTGSAHQILANDITAGVTTFTQITVSRNGDLTVPGTISIGGTLTYEDVTSVDSVGIVTARGLSIFGNTTGLSVTGVGTFAGDVSIADKIVHTGDTDTAIRFPSVNQISFETAGSERVRIDGGGNLLIGTTAARTFGGGVYAHLQLEGTTQQGSQFTVTRNSNDTYSPNISLVKTRGTSDGAVTTVQDNDSLGTIQFRGADGSDVFAVAASITGEVDGSPSDGTDMPGALVFGTTADGAASPTERVRIASNGYIGINNNSAGTRLHVSQDWVNSYGSISVEGSANALVGLGLRSNGNYRASLIWRDGSSGNYMDLATYGGSYPLLFRTNGTEGARISGNQNLLVGTTTDSQRLHVYNGNGGTGYKTALFDSNDTSNGTRVVITNSGNTSNRGLGIIVGGQAGTNNASLGWFNNDNTYVAPNILTITSDSQILMGGTSAYGNFENSSTNPRLQVRGTDLSGSCQAWIRATADAGAPKLFLANNRNTSGNSHTVVQDNDELGGLFFAGSDGSQFVNGAGILSYVAGSPGADDVPGYLSFHTNGGSAATTERMRINENGHIIPGTNNTYNIGASSNIFAGVFANYARLFTNLAVGSGTNLQSGNVASFKGNDYNQVNIAHQNNSGWGMLLTNSDASTYNSGYHETTNSSVNSPIAIVNVNADCLYLATNNTPRWRVDHSGHFIPLSTHNIGSSSKRAGTVYATNSYNTSDRNEKNTITESDLGLDFICKLKPVSYKWNQKEGEGLDTKTHYGLISQDVEDVIIETGKTLDDFGAVDKPEKGAMGLSYNEFISPLVKAIQELSAENTALKARLDAAGL